MYSESSTGQTTQAADSTLKEFMTALLLAVVLQLTLPDRFRFQEFIAFRLASDQAYDQLLTLCQRTQENFLTRTNRLQEELNTKDEKINEELQKKLKEAVNNYFNQITAAKKEYYPLWMNGNEEITMISLKRSKGV